jgi:putative acid phosphatase of HAD superfamily subfamily IIIB
MRDRLSRASRVTRYAIVFAAGLALGAAALAGGAALVKTSTTKGTPVFSVRPTGVGLPRIGASGTVGAGDYATPLKDYHDSGRYRHDLQTVDDAARSYLKQRVSQLGGKAARRCAHARAEGASAKTRRKACRAPKLAIVLDIDETSLSNYKYISGSDFSNPTAGLALAVANADDPPVAPTLRLYHLARDKGVAVFFITGRPGNIPMVRSQTVANLQSAGYKHWAGLALKPSSDKTVPFKSGQRAKIQSQGYQIIANLGDQESDLQGGYADRAFKLPNPFYFIGP